MYSYRSITKWKYPVDEKYNLLLLMCLDAWLSLVSQFEEIGCW
jgi:hypothetical protein